MLHLPLEYSDLVAEKERLSTKLAAISAKLRELRKATMESAGWKRCCRCFPSCVHDDGFCGCCLYNHVTGKQIEHPKSFFEASEDEPRDS